MTTPPSGISDRVYDWATTWPETRPRYVVRVAMDLANDATNALMRWRHGNVKCRRCAGGGMVAPGDCCPSCGGSGTWPRTWWAEQ